MISAEYAIHRFRRDVTLGTLVRFALLAGALLCVSIGPFTSAAFDATGEARNVSGSVLDATTLASEPGSTMVVVPSSLTR